MTNFSVNFTNPWFLFLLIFAAVFTLIPYFRLAKKYRRTRNRVVSIVLHLIIMGLSVAVLAGITFEYDIPNDENEVILLVDVSDSGSEITEQKKDEFIQQVLDASDSLFKVGIVTFGFDQVYAVQLSSNTDGMYSDYLSADAPDTTATDISSAINYASSLFKNPQTARIVVLSDGVETDNEALRTIKSVAAQGIKVDTVYFSETVSEEVQVMGVTPPERNIVVGEPFTMTIDIKSNYVGGATLKIFDNANEKGVYDVELISGIQTVEVEMTFDVPGVHQLSFEISSATDTLAHNNTFNSYIYLEIYDDILIIESIVEESQSIKNMLNDELNVTVVSVDDTEKMPNTLEKLCAYDEVILVNVANEQLPDGFDEILYTYVHDVGGGLFTVCGGTEDSTAENPIANAYTKEDMQNTIYQDMLPVEVINYTPPLAVIIIIDRSGSMAPEGTAEDRTPLFAAKQGAAACLDALTVRDWVGIMTLESTYSEEVAITPRTQREKILNAIDAIEVGGWTEYSGALDRAGRALLACDVEKRHIILVSDGEPTDDPELYLDAAEQNAKRGITMSYINIGGKNKNAMIELLEAAGMGEENYHEFTLDEIDRVPSEMREELMVPEIKDVNYETFKVEINSYGAVVNNVNQADIPTLDGFYGTRAKDGAEVVLMGAHVPIYAQWKYGAGMVGSFMCDLNGTWSSAFVTSLAGETLINNIVMALFPTENIKPNDIALKLDEGNYYNRLSIMTDIEEGQSVVVTVKGPAVGGGESTQILNPSATDGYSRQTITIQVPGLHEITVQKLDASGLPIAQNKIYKAFSYSQEYNVFIDEDAGEKLLAELAEDGEGMVITDAQQVLDNTLKYLHRVIDPRIVFIIIALVAFLLDIAVRKFKFKWPHEIIRDRKARRAMLSQDAAK